MCNAAKIEKATKTKLQTHLRVYLICKSFYHFPIYNKKKKKKTISLEIKNFWEWKTENVLGNNQCNLKSTSKNDIGNIH